MAPADLDAVFRAAPPGEIPRGEAAGTILWRPGTRAARPAALAIRALLWRGKAFRPDTRDMENRLGPTAIPGVRAKVYVAGSWLDDRPCVVLDYSGTSRVAGWIRDEMREIAPGRNLGLAWGRVPGGRRIVLRFTLTFGAGEAA